MDRNLSALDRTVRVVLGAAMFGGGLFLARGLLRVALCAVGAVLVFSGAVGFCHVYKFFGICSADKQA